MQSNEYLYGKDVEIEEIPAEVILSRVTPLKEHLSALTNIPLANRTYEDMVRANAVSKAVKFWNDINKR